MHFLKPGNLPASPQAGNPFSQSPGLENFRSLLSLFSDAAVVTNTNLDVVEMNAPAARVFQGRHVFIGNNIAGLLQADANTCFETFQKKILLKKSATRTETFIVTGSAWQNELVVFVWKPENVLLTGPGTIPAEAQRWKFALQGAGDGMWEYNCVTGEVFYSKEYKQMLGYSEEEFPNEPEAWRDKIHTDDRHLVQKADEAYENALISQHELEYRLRNKQGEYIWILDRGMLVERTADGKPAKIIGTHKNIHNQKKHLEDVASKEARLRFLSDNAPAVIHEYIFYKDGSSGFGYISNSCERLLGLSSKEMLHFNTMLHPEDLKKMQAIDNKTIIAAQAFQFEGRLLIPGGSVIWVSVQSAYSKTNDSGDIIFTGIILNITEKKKQEAELKENETRFHNIAQSVPGVVYQWQANADGSYQFNYVSPKSKTYFNLEPDEMHQWPSLIHPDDKERWRASIEDAKQHSGEWNFTGRLLYPDGSVKWWKGSSVMSDSTEQALVYNGIMIDITEQVAAEEKIREQEQRFKAIFNCMYQFIGLANTQGMIIEANQPVLQFSGLSKEEVINHYFWEFPVWQSSSVSSEKIQEAYMQAVAGQFVRFPIEFFIKGQENIIIDFSLKPVKNDDGVVEWIIPEGRNITRERRAEKNMIKLQAHFISFMENTPALSWIVDDNDIIRYLNPPYLKAFNLTDAAIGKSMYDLFPKEICDAYKENNERVWASGEALETIEQGIAPDGTALVHHIFKFPLHPDGDTRLLGGTAIDITQLQNTKEELHLSNERFEYAAMATTDAIWDWDKRNDRIYRGKGFEELFGYASQADNMEYRLSHIHEEDKPKVIASIAQALNGKRDRWQFEYRYKCADGLYKTVMDRGFILRNEEGEAIRMIGAMQDITERRRLEEKVAQEQELKKKDILKAIIDAQERERADISYALHENISQVLATSKLMLQMNAQSHDADTRYMSVGLENLQTAINDLRSISQQLNPGIVDIVGLQGAIGDLVEQVNLQGQIEVQLMFTDFNDQDLAKEIKISLFRIVQEQLKNIQKHSKAGHIQIKMSTRKGKVVLVIADDGKGFNTSTTKMGLGLKNIMNRTAFHNGTAKLRSYSDKGCFLQVEIPTMLH